MGRRQVGRRMVAVVAVVAMGSLSCGGGASPPPPPGPIARAEAQDLRVAVGEDPFLAGDPPTPNLGLMVDAFNPGIFETLTTLTPSFGLTAGLATRWEAETPTRWRFEIRPGVRFHDGTPLTAQAAAETLRRVAEGLASPESDSVGRRQSLPRGLTPASATTEGDHVLVVELSEANLRLAEQLANPSMAVVAPATVPGGGATAADTPTGTGPFRFDSYVPGSELRVVANDDHWQGPPELASITFRYGPAEDASRLLATREVELVGMIPPPLLARESGRTNRVVASPGARSAFVLLNRGGVGEWSTLQDGDLRRALALALDRAAVAEAGWPGAEANDTLIPPVVLNDAAGAVVAPPQDPDRARQLLEGAGWVLGGDGIRTRDGQRLVLSLLVRSSDAVLAQASEVMRSQLAEVGIELDVSGRQPGDPSPLQRVNAATFDLFLDVRPQDDADPCAMCRFFSIRPGGQLSVSGVAGAGPAADALFDQVHQAPSLDSARRVAAEVMSVVIAEEVVAIPLAVLPNPWSVSSRVQGFSPASLAGAQRWDSVFLAR